MQCHVVLVHEVYIHNVGTCTYRVITGGLECILCSVCMSPVPRTQSAGVVVGNLRQCWRHPLSRLLRSWWRVIVVILTPLLFLPIPIVLKDDVSTIIFDSQFWERGEGLIVT